MLLSEGLTKLFGLLDEIVQLTETLYQSPPKLSKEEILDMMIQAMILTKESIVLRVGKEFVTFLNKCVTIISDLEKMGREIRPIIPEGIKDFPMTLGKYITRKKDYAGFYLDVDDGESILQIEKDGKKNIFRCFIQNCVNNKASHSFPKVLQRETTLQVVNYRFLK
jgi:hypothetical protein